MKNCSEIDTSKPLTNIYSAYILINKKDKRKEKEIGNMNKNQKFGVEIEILQTVASREEIAQAIRNEGVRVQAEFYNHNTSNQWKVITDSSCGYEIVSPPMTINGGGFDEIEKVCRALDSVGAKVNRSCGLHVHIDAGGYNQKQVMAIASAYSMQEKFFDLLVPQSRRGNNNTYCQSNLYRMANWSNREHNAAKENVTNALNRLGTRYLKVNLQAYARHGTIEFRQHSGTTNAEKIINWVALLLQFADVAKDGSYRSKVVADYFGHWKNKNGIKSSHSDEIIAKLSEYLNNRFKELNPSLGLTYKVNG